MTRAELVNGTKVFVVKIEQLVSLGVFSRALGNEFYTHLSEEIEQIIHDTEHNPFRGHFDTEGFERSIEELVDGSEFFKRMSKHKAQRLLRANLRLYGREGSIDSTDYEASFERGFALARCRDAAHDWVVQKYPYLEPAQ